MLDWDLPNRMEIEQAARKVLPNLPAATQQVIESDPNMMERVVEVALGLTLVEAENVFAKSAVRTHTFDLETILEEKKQIIRKSGLLEYYEHREEFSDVGGMDDPEGLAGQAPRRVRLAREGLRAAAAEGHPADRRAGHRQVAHREGGRRAVADAAAAPRRRQDLRRPRR